MPYTEWIKSMINSNSTIVIIRSNDLSIDCYE